MEKQKRDGINNIHPAWLIMIFAISAGFLMLADNKYIASLIVTLAIYGMYALKNLKPQLPKFLKGAKE